MAAGGGETQLVPLVRISGQRSCTLGQGGGLPVRQGLVGQRCGAHEVVDRLVRQAERVGPVEVVGQALDQDVGLRAPSLQDAGDRGVGGGEP